MNLWHFYVVHSVRDMLRNRQRTLFALFCVAAGVAAVVALRMLGLMIADALTTNIAALNHGDIVMMSDGAVGLTEETPDKNVVFTARTVERVREWAAARDIEVTTAFSDIRLQIAPIRDGRVGRPQLTASFFIEPDRYPFYSEVTALDPPGVPLRDLLVDSDDIVLAENTAARIGVAVGDQVRLSRAEEFFTVSGIIPTESENFTQNPETVIFGYVYLSLDQMPLLGLEPLPDEIYLKLSEDSDIQEALSSLRRSFYGVSLRSRDEVLEDNQFIADAIGDFILIMGLAAMVVGGVGIINTMLVVVGRRTVEIAVLKTLGLKGSQVTLLFLVEAVLIGLFGSLLGLVLGVALSFAAQRVGETFLQQSLRWYLSLDPLIIGVAMGVTVTTVFGFLPTLAAARVRPAVVLRPVDVLLPRAGFLQRLLALLALTLVLGLIAAQIIGDPGAGFILAGAGMLALGILTGLFWVVVWAIGKLPSFGWVDLKLALRQMTTKRSRTASSLVALTGGIFALSLITLMSSTIVEILNFGLTEQLGGNVMAMTFFPGASQMMTDRLDEFPDVTYSRIANYRAELVAINGSRDIDAFLAERLGADQTSVSPESLSFAFSFLTARDVQGEPMPDTPMVAGRQLGPQDAGQSVIVLPDSLPGLGVSQFGFVPGDRIRLRLRSFNRSIVQEFEVVGIKRVASGMSVTNMNLSRAAVIPLDSLPEDFPPEATIVIANAPDDRLNELLLALSDVPGAFTFDVGSLSATIERMLQQMVAIPLLVAGLAMFAGATIIANTVSLTTLERRRQIGIMKALGLKGWRVLGQLLLENAIIGLVGGLVGVGVSALIIGMVTQFGGRVEVFQQSISGEQVVILLSLAVGIALFATILTAWGASREKPMNVLRYE